MASVSQPPANSASTVTTSLSSSNLSNLAAVLKANPGTPVQIAILSPTQIQLQTPKGNVSLTVPKLKVPVTADQPFVAQIKTGPDSTLLEISHRFQQQQLNLTAAQSKQVIEQISQNPVLRESSVQLKAKVVAVLQNQIQLSIAGKTVALNVSDVSQFKAGQWVTLDMPAKQNVVTIQPDKTSTSLNQKTQQPLKVTPEVATKLLDSALKSGKPMQLNIDVARAVPELPVANNLRTSATNQQNTLNLFSKGQRSVLTMPLSQEPILKVALPDNKVPELNRLNIFQTDKLASSIKVSAEVAGKDPAGATAKSVSPPTNIMFDKPTISKSDIVKSQSPQVPPTTTAQSVVTESSLTKEPSTTTERSALSQSTNPPKAVNKLIQQYQSQLGKEQSQQITQLLNRLAEVAGKFDKPQVSLQEVTHVVQQLAQQVQSKTGSVLKLQEQLVSLLKELGVSKLDPVIKTALREAITKVQPDATQLSNIDASQVKQLLQASSVPMSTPAISAVTSQSGFVAGLISLLQVSLAARQQRSQPKALETLIQNLLPVAAASGSDKKSDGAPKSSKELNKLEQKLGLLKLSTDSLEELAHSKLKNIERRLQGQEAMHLILPFTGHNDKPVAELLIKRQLDDEQKQEKQKQQHQIWHLTMKLQIGELGEVLCKSTLNGQSLDVEFYTSNNKLKDMVFNFAPLLKLRLQECGIEMTLQKCQRGEIPDTLDSRPYQLFQAKA